MADSAAPASAAAAVVASTESVSLQQYRCIKCDTLHELSKYRPSQQKNRKHKTCEKCMFDALPGNEKQRRIAAAGKRRYYKLDLEERTIFYCFQSQLPLQRYFILNALEAAKDQLNAEKGRRWRYKIDQSSRAKAGMHMIADTLLQKISDASIFVADVTFCNAATIEAQKESQAEATINVAAASAVAAAASEAAATSAAASLEADRLPTSRMMPNPNVLLELGFAMHAVEFSRCIMVRDETVGERKDLPFDIAGSKYVPFLLPNSAEQKQLRSEIDALKTVLAVSVTDGAVRAALTSQLAAAEQRFSALPVDARTLPLRQLTAELVKEIRHVEEFGVYRQAGIAEIGKKFARVAEEIAQFERMAADWRRMLADERELRAAIHAKQVELGT